jgi:pyridoxine/pyridoxamine 5'-phosphate oxidase
MTPHQKRTILEYLRAHRLAVVSSLSASGGPQSALVGVAVTDALEIVFDTISTSRKHANLAADPRAAVTFSGPGEQTLQYEGRAIGVDLDDEVDRHYRETYYAAWPECRPHRAWPNIAYWRIVPAWIRYSDYDRGPLFIELTLD